MTTRRALTRLLGAAALTACALVMGQSTYTGQVALRGNHPAEAAALAGGLRADPAMPLELTMVLGLRNQAALEQLLSDQQDPASRHYRRWLTPKEFADRFGPTDKQISQVKEWLKGEGFAVTSVNRIARTIRASGDAATAERAFSTTLLSEGASFANTTDPAIPAQFDGLIISIMGLDNMHAAVPAGLHRITPPSPHSSMQRKTETLALVDATASNPESNAEMPGASEGGSVAFGPKDVETFYDEMPLINGGDTGSPAPDCVALDEDSDYLPSAVTLYDSTFGLTPGPVTNVYPEGSSPGISGDEVETLLDIDYAQAAAPGTPIHPYISGDLYDSISQSVTDGTCGAISISFIFCGESSSFYTGLDTLFQEAATQGQSVFIASGDWGAAGLQYSGGACVTGTVKNASEIAASPHVTAVGGTTFNPQFNSSGNDISEVEVGSGGVESAWNASGGGASAIFPKPTWQTGLGVPADGARDIPDVAMIAWAPYVFIGADDNGTAIIQCCWGGTSLATPLWAGYSRILGVASDNPRLGLLNVAIYKIANAGLAVSGIEDVVSGNNTYNGVTGYTAGPGYDQVTGWGSVDMTQFANAFTGGPQPTATASSSPTPSATATRTATATSTLTPTATASATTRGTVTATPTSTGTATAIRTATATVTSTATATPTATTIQTAQPSPTATGTAATATATSTPTTAATSTATHTPTATASSTVTSTPTRTATATATATPTSAPTLTPTATATSTATQTATATASQTPSATPTQTPVPPALTVAPTKLKFGKVAIGATSSVQMVTLSNKSGSKAAPITLNEWNPTGDFSVSQGVTTCAPGTTLRPGQKCKIGLTFKPTLAGARSGTLTIEDNAHNNQQVIQLKGTGK
jgi:subtilase family serine protease